MQILNWTELDENARAKALERPNALHDPKIPRVVGTILSTVRKQGDAALCAYTQEFDGIEMTDFALSRDTAKTAWETLAPQEQQALLQAKANIETYHKPQIPTPYEVLTMDGVLCRREIRALESVGLYVPGGSAPLVSTVLMLAIPAKIAGVPRIVMVSPPNKDGELDQRILAAAYLCGVDEIYALGGAQAIGALAYGTQSIQPVVKIFGPGNAYVAEAKAQVASKIGGPAIDLPAGPSEVMVLSDSAASPAFIAADLLSQAEHDPMAQCLCICSDKDFVDQIITQIKLQVPQLSRQCIVNAALKNARICLVDSRKDMIKIANSYAPEHLIIQIQNPEDVVADIQNAGSIFLGPWTPEALGDYASGTNHTLPTYGAARAYSGVNVESFTKAISVQKLSKRGLQRLGPSVEILADMEGLDAHKNAVSLRLKEAKA